ncbi:MAG: uracil-DNA glycosylase [Hyphomicrobiaceae bacterium]
MTEGNPQHEQALGDLLAWYREIGVDEVLSDSPIDWLARGDAAPGQNTHINRPAHREPRGVTPRDELPQPGHRNTQVDPTKTETHPASPYAPVAWPHNTTPRAPQQPIAPSTDTLVTHAQALANGAENLEQLSHAIATFDGCSLKATAKNACVFRGAEIAHLMVIGEAPGRDEDLTGKPFVGRAGQLLDKMLASIGVDETNVHITNTVYWRPPGNRTPTPQEIQICRPFLDRQVALVQPTHLMLLGGAAAKSIFETTQGVMKTRGKWRKVSFGNETFPTMATLHPAYLLRTPAAKRSVWRDLLSLKQRLK